MRNGHFGCVILSSDLYDLACYKLAYSSPLRSRMCFMLTGSGSLSRAAEPVTVADLHHPAAYLPYVQLFQALLLEMTTQQVDRLYR